jgi:hypothetical protein
MLAALLQNNNNNAQVQPQPWTVKNVRDSAGPSRSYTEPPQPPPEAHYNIADIAAAASTFPEIAGEDPATRAARRVQWISGALPFVKEAREKQAAAAFMVGAQLADAAAEARHAIQDQLKIEQLIAIIDEVRGDTKVAPSPPRQPMRGERVRGTGGSGVGLFVGGLVVGGILVGLALSSKSAKPRRFM